ncbi:MAG: hypothetical protein U0172_11215 [Nitrospiraceae bacterium]
MEQQTIVTPAGHPTEGTQVVEQRRVRRLAESCYITYSGLSGGAVVVGEGTSVDIAAEGFGIEGSRPVKIGALLTLCFCLPDGQEPLVVEEMRVAWVNGKRFGGQSVAIGHEERKRLAQYVARHPARHKKSDPAALDFVLPLEPVVIDA